MSTSTGRMQKSIRLSPDESKLLGEVSKREHLSETALLRKWVLDGLDHARLNAAIADYESGQLNLGEAAVRAGLPVERMMNELDARGIDTISVDHFYASLENFARVFGASPELTSILESRRAVREAPS